MIVLDGFRINPPYDTVVGAPGQVSGLERVIKVVSILYLQLHSQFFYHYNFDSIYCGHDCM